MISRPVEQAITEFADVVSRMDDVDRACELVCDRLHSVLEGPVAILERAGLRWQLRASAQSPGAHEVLDEPSAA